MPTCFVIQPFDSGKYDKRFRDIYKPAIEAAGLEAYRVDQDPSVAVPIDAIEKGIRQATVCLADITTDNPNVWYELGYAFAGNRPVVMVCSQERPGGKYPFDIQHRAVIPYQADSPSDFEQLKTALTEKIKAMVSQGETLRQIEDAAPLAATEGLSQVEILVLAVLAGDVLPGVGIAVYSAKKDAERAGLTGVGFNVALRRLKAKGLLEARELWDERSDESYEGIAVTEAGWQWVEDNEALFVLHRPEKKPNAKDDLPF